MKLPCIRCGDLIDKARKGNAKYITNESDVKTHGPVERDIFEVYRDGVAVKAHKKLKDAQEDCEKERNKIKPHRDKLKDELDAISDELKAIPDLPENASARSDKKIKLMGKNNDLFGKIELMRSMKVVRNPVVVSVPKTGIICLKEECQDENDVIIWG